MRFLSADNAATVLADSLAIDGTTLQVTGGTGVLFPVPVEDISYFVATLSDSTGVIREIVHVLAVDDDTFTIVRAQEGTDALAWSAGSNVEQLITAAQIQGLVQISTGGPVVLPLRSVTAAGPVTMLDTDYELAINQTVAAPIDVTLMTAPAAGTRILVTDAKGDASTNRIRVKVPAGATLNGISGSGAYYDITADYGWVFMRALDPTTWSITG